MVAKIVLWRPLVVDQRWIRVERRGLVGGDGNRADF